MHARCFGRDWDLDDGADLEAFVTKILHARGKRWAAVRNVLALMYLEVTSNEGLELWTRADIEERYTDLGGRVYVNTPPGEPRRKQSPNGPWGYWVDPCASWFTAPSGTPSRTVWARHVHGSTVRRPGRVTIRRDQFVYTPTHVGLAIGAAIVSQNMLGLGDAE